MEAVAALSLASNVIQILDFSARFTRRCISIYTSGSHSDTELEALKYEATELTRLNVSLQDSLQTNADPSLPPPEVKALRGIAEKCLEDSKVLFQKTEKITSGCGQGWRKAFVQAFRIRLEERDIASILSRLAKYRKLLETEILVQLRSRIEQFCPDSLARINELQLKVVDLNDSIEQNRSFLQSQQQSLDRLESSTDELLRQQNGLADQLREVSISIGDQLDSNISQMKQSHNLLGQKIEGLDQCKNVTSGTITLNTAITDSNEGRIKLRNTLWFPEISKRQSEIREAHKATFRWILDSPSSGSHQWHPFKIWLEGSSTNVYWVRGKAGSGKSTLMTYIINEPKTKSSLLQWCQKDKLLILKHFFWSSGSDLQNSIVGFLRSMIFQILEALPQLTSMIFPSEAENLRIVNSPYESNSKTWTQNELQRLLISILKLDPDFRGNFCFFIDGLDESKDEALHVIDIIDSISEFQNVKLCVSSRPLVEYITAFRTYPLLKLEDLTQKDIERYVQDTLSKNRLIQEYIDHNEFLVKRISNLIVGRAEGVFLWVKIAVESMNSGLVLRETENSLLSNLYGLPSDIENLYGHMLDRIFSRQNQKLEAAVTFQMLFLLQKMGQDEVTVGESLVDLALAKHFAFSAVTGQARPLSGYLSKVVRDETVRLSYLGAGFIEIDEEKRTAKFYHKTAIDFLSRLDIWAKITQPTSSSNFDAYESFFDSQIYMFDNLSEVGLPKQIFSNPRYIWRSEECKILFWSLSWLASHRRKKRDAVPGDVVDHLETIFENQKHRYTETVRTWDKVLSYIRIPGSITESMPRGFSPFADNNLRSGVQVMDLLVLDGMVLYLQQKLVGGDEGSLLTQSRTPLYELGDLAENHFATFASSVLSLLLSYLLDCKATASTLQIFTKWAWQELLHILNLPLYRGGIGKSSEKANIVESPIITAIKLLLGMEAEVEVNQVQHLYHRTGKSELISPYWARFFTPLWAFEQMFKESACGYHDTVKLFKDAGALSRSKDTYDAAKEIPPPNFWDESPV